MMQLHVYCPCCLAELAKEGKQKGIDSLPPILSDVYELLNNGIYTIHCPKGHDGTVVLENLDFELLYDLGINAIADKYYREAVASSTSALERFYAFFVKTVWRFYGLQFDVIDANWKKLASQSERQYGAYVMAYSAVFGESAPVLSDAMRSFRNSVIHNGEIPTREKSVEYARIILELIDGPLTQLRSKCPEVVREVFMHYIPHYEKKAEGEALLRINHPTIIRACEEFVEEDQRRNHDIEFLIESVLDARNRRRMWLVDKGERQMISEDYEGWLARRMKSAEGQEEYHVVVDPNADVLEFLNKLGEQIDEYDGIIGWVHEEHPEICHNDIMTILVGNTQILSQLYLLYTRVKVYQLLLENNPEDEGIKEGYEIAEKELIAFHEHLTCYE